MAPATLNTVAQPDLTPMERNVWGDLIRSRCGMAFSESRVRVLRQSLWTRMKLRSCPSYTDYYHYVAYHPAGDVEWKELLDLLLNNETCFFRHAPSFEALSSHVLPELLRYRDVQQQSALRLWSAGCSAGQEAYSLAMTVLEVTGGRGWKPMILGTDLSPSCLEQARSGQFRPFEMRNLNATMREKYMRELPASGRSAAFEMTEAVRSLVRFYEFNLTDPETYPRIEQDVIFCQNVLVYMAVDQRMAIARHLAQCLGPGGFLFLGPAEVIGLKCPELEAVQLPDALVYRRTA